MDDTPSVSQRRAVVRIHINDDDDYDDDPSPITKNRGRRASSHDTDLFVRYQEISDDSWACRYHYLLYCSLLGNGTDMFPTTLELAMTLSGGAEYNSYETRFCCNCLSCCRNIHRYTCCKYAFSGFASGLHGNISGKIH